jgi:hypothetical protein
MVAQASDLFGLRIPEQHSEKSTFDLRPKKVEEWVAALPLGNIDETSRKVFSTLTSLNRLVIPPQTRLEIMDLLFDPIQHCTQAFRRFYTGQSFPLSNKNLRYVDRSLAMYQELGYAYKTIVVNFLARNRFFEKKSLNKALYYALRTLSETLLTYYKIYAPEPAFLWSEIHRLYQISEGRKLHQTLVRNNRYTKQDTSIEKAYKQAILLALSNPYHLRNKEVDNVYKCLETWSDYVRLCRPEEDIAGTSGFVACLNSDRSPVQLDLVKTLDGSSCRFIDTTDLNQFLRNQIARSQEDDDTPQDESRTLDDPLLRRLYVSWDNRGKRNFSRSETEGKTEISIGLNSTHFLMEEENRLFAEQQQDDSSEEELAETDDARKAEENNPLDITHTTFRIEPLPGKGKGEVYWDASGDHAGHEHTLISGDMEISNIPEPSYNAHSWKTLNVSAGGYCLLWDHDRSSNAQVGEIVGIRESSHGQNPLWSVGVVRWMQYIRNEGLKLGIQILAPQATTLQARLMSGRASKKKEYSCLSLPEIRAMHQPASLVTSTLQYKVGDALILNDHGKLINVQLTRLVENTGNYSRFLYTPINKKEISHFEKEIERQSGEWKKLF